MYQVSHDAKKKFKIQRFLLSKLDPKLASFYSTRGFPLDRRFLVARWESRSLQRPAREWGQGYGFARPEEPWRGRRPGA